MLSLPKHRIALARFGIAAPPFTPRQVDTAVTDDRQDRQPGPWANQFLDVLLCLEIALLAIVLLLWPMPVVPLPPIFP